MSAALDYRGMVLFMGGHLTDTELIDAWIEIHLLIADRFGADGPHAEPLDPPRPTEI